MKINTVKSIILASSSPYRQALLQQTGLRFTAKAPTVDEKSITHAAALGLACLRAQKKALSLIQHSEALIIGADQVLEFNQGIIEKVDHREEALMRLKDLSGKEHCLHNGITLCLTGKKPGSVIYQKDFTTTVRLKMRLLADDELKAYVETGEWQGSVGCYKIEGRGIQLFDKIDGNQSDIIGLPLRELLAELRHIGIHPLLNNIGPWDVVLK